MYGCQPTPILTCIHDERTKALVFSISSDLAFTHPDPVVVPSDMFDGKICANSKAKRNISGVLLTLYQGNLTNASYPAIAYMGYFLMCNDTMLQKAITEGKTVTVKIKPCLSSAVPTSAATTANTVKPFETSRLSNQSRPPFPSKPSSDVATEPTVPTKAIMSTEWILPIVVLVSLVAGFWLPIIIWRKYFRGRLEDNSVAMELQPPASNAENLLLRRTIDHIDTE